MLTVAKVTKGSAGGYADYLEGKTTPAGRGDYYLKDGERVEAPGRWITGANAVGCDGAAPVAGEALRALLDVRRPDNGQPLRQAGAGGGAVAAIDATFSAPKSVSAAWALSRPDLRAQIETAHERAIDRALQYALQHVAMVRQRTELGAVSHRRASDLIATSWRHTTARAVADRLPDPQLHSHVLLHAAVRDQRIVAIDSRSWLVHRREIGAAYRTELARELATIGFAIQRGTGRAGRYFEIRGIPTELTDRWSSRHHQVQDAIRDRLAARRAETGDEPPGGHWPVQRRPDQLSPREDRWVTAHTRSRKRTTTVHDLDAQWLRDAHAVGFPATGEQLVAGGPAGPAIVDTSAVEAALTEFDATFSTRDARAVALEQGCGAPIDAALEAVATLREAGTVIELADGRLTTASHRAAEQATIAAAERAAAERAEPFEERVVQQATDMLAAELADRGATITDEQRHAIEVACSDRPVVIIEGQAGSGKSTVLQAIGRAHQASGQMVIVTSTSGLAAQRLANELHNAEVEAVCFSTVGLQHAIQDGRLTLSEFTTVIHDEAALASTRELEPLLARVGQSGARLILIGDPEQSHPVGAGGLWPYLDHAATRNDATLELTHNVRARDPADRRDQQRFRTGDHELALHGYAARKHVHLHDTHTDAEDAALEAAHADRRSGHSTLVIAQTSNEHLDELNARAQALRLHDQELGPGGLPLAGRPYDLHAGDHIQIRNTIRRPGHGQIRNGTTAIITHVDRSGERAELRLGDGSDISLTVEQLDDAQTRLAYVQHPFPAQGATSDTTHIITGEHISREGSYVALTRARDRTDIHASHELLNANDTADREPISLLADRMSRAEPDLPSIATPLAHEAVLEHEPAREPADDAPDPTPASAEPDPPSRTHCGSHGGSSPLSSHAGVRADRQDRDAGSRTTYPARPGPSQRMPIMENFHRDPDRDDGWEL